MVVESPETTDTKENFQDPRTFLAYSEDQHVEPRRSKSQLTVVDETDDTRKQKPAGWAEHLLRVKNWC